MTNLYKNKMYTVTMSLPEKNEINSKKRHVRKEISFKNIVKWLEDGDIVLPPIQGNLNGDSVKEMAKEYKDDPYFKCKDNISIGVLEEDCEYKYYIVDGQHRLEMVRKLMQKKDAFDDKLQFNFVYCNTKREFNKFFESMNKDSKKNAYKLDMKITRDDVLYEIKKTLSELYYHYFSNASGSKKQLYTIEEFIKMLKKEQKYIKGFEDGVIAVADIITNNIAFNKQVNKTGYTQISTYCSDKLFKEEQNILKMPLIYTIGFKNNNFGSKWLFDMENCIAEHTGFKKVKGKTEEALIQKVWKHMFGTKKKDICPVYRCKNDISLKNFDAGHIISDKHGGEKTLNNLKPICGSCNSKMGSMNWDEYEEKVLGKISNKKKLEKISDDAGNFSDESCDKETDKSDSESSDSDSDDVKEINIKDIKKKKE